MAEGGAPAGPDLAAGIPSGELPEGGMLAGRFGEDAVLLARVQGKVLAVGANCTHYGGPLAEGVLDGDTVRCPWHHACFSLRTGEMLRTPALNDLPKYEVAELDGTIRVTGRVHEGGPLERGGRGATKLRPRSSPESIVIVGAGAAGNAAAEELRRAGYDGPVTMVDADTDAPYDRPNLSKDYLAGTAPEEWIPLHPGEFYDEREIAIVRGRAARLDVKGRELVLEDGRTLSYGALLLATGAEPVRLNTPAAAGSTVRVLRSLADSRELIRLAEANQRVVVIGASFIGLEVAASLRQRGLDVHVVAPEEVPLARVMGTDLGRWVHTVHEAHGVVFHLGHTVKSIGARDVTLDDDSTLAADFVVMGVGVRPRVSLAREAGIDEDNGVLVDAQLRTSAPNVWAAGDIARYPDPITGERIRVEHWVLAERHGQIAARNILGADEPFAQAPFFWSQHYDGVIAYVGHAQAWDEAVLEGDPANLDCAVQLRKDGRLLALASIYRDEQSLRTELELESGVSN